MFLPAAANRVAAAAWEDSCDRIENFSRRDFLKGVAGTSAFALGVSVLPKRVFAENRMALGIGDPSKPMSKAPLQPSVYLAIDTDGTTYVISHRSEMGNGVRASLPRIVADELDADWARVKVVQATGDEKYGDQDTDGSHSVVSFFIPLREAGATARLMLVRAAAKQVERARNRMLDRIAHGGAQEIRERRPATANWRKRRRNWKCRRRKS